MFVLTSYVLGERLYSHGEYLLWVQDCFCGFLLVEK